MDRIKVPCVINTTGDDFVVLTPTETLDATTIYYVTVTTDVKSTLDENLEEQFNSHFTTMASPVYMHFLISDSWPDEYDMIDISPNDYFYLYFDYEIDPFSIYGKYEGATITYGTPVAFTKADYEDIIDVISSAVHIERDSSRGIYNSVTESSYDNVNYTSPADTEWNADGWNDLTNIKDRGYSNWAYSVGWNPASYLVDREMIMHIISEDRYFKVKFSAWTPSAGGGGFSYDREEVFMSGGSYVEGNVNLLQDGTPVPCNMLSGLFYEAEGPNSQQITITPDSMLLSDSVYTLQAKTGLKSIEGYYLDEQVDLSFTTEVVETFMYLLESDPGPIIDVPVDKICTITFDYDIYEPSVSENVLLLDVNSEPVSCIIEISGTDSKVIIITPDAPLSRGLEYTIRCLVGLLSVEGYYLDQEYDISFTTIVGPLMYAESIDPIDYYISGINTPVTNRVFTITFDHDVDPDTVQPFNVPNWDDTGEITLYPVSLNAMSAEVSSVITVNNNIVTLTCDDNLLPAERYAFTVSPSFNIGHQGGDRHYEGVKSIEGYSIPTFYSTTYFAESDLLKLIEGIPMNGGYNILPEDDIQLYFNKDIDWPHCQDYPNTLIRVYDENFVTPSGFEVTYNYFIDQFVLVITPGNSWNPDFTWSDVVAARYTVNCQAEAPFSSQVMFTTRAGVIETVGTQPSNDAINIPVDQLCYIDTTYAINPTHQTIIETANPLFDININSTRVTFTPKSNLETSQVYSIGFPIRVYSVEGYACNATGITFRTVELPLTFTSVYTNIGEITEGQTDIPIDTYFSVRFTEDLDMDTVNSSTLILTDSLSNVVESQYARTTNGAIITPGKFQCPINLVNGEIYTITMTTDIKSSIGGQNLDQEYVFSFTTIEL